MNDQYGFFELARLTLLANPRQLIKDMMYFDKDNIDERVAKRVNVTLASPSFNLNELRSTSYACYVFYEWTQVLMKYHNKKNGILSAPYQPLSGYG